MADDLTAEVDTKELPSALTGNSSDMKDYDNVDDNNTTEVTNSAFEKLQLLAEDSLEFFQESKNTETLASSQIVEKYVPGPLPKTSTSLEDIKHRLLSLIVRGEEEEEEETVITCVRPKGAFLDEVHKIALLSHTMAAYVSTLDENLVRRIALQVVSETTLWIGRMFRFFDSSAYFHSDGMQGLIRMVRLVLILRYPKYLMEGYEALYTRPPVIYCNDTTRPGLGQFLCLELGLPISCLSSIPSNTIVGSQFKMDTSALEKLILEDNAASKIPLLVVASAGAPLLGHVDNLQRLQELCHAHNIWLHIDGHSLAALSLVSVPNLPSNVGDSMTLCLGKWIGIPSLPFITLYKSQDAMHLHPAGLGQATLGQLSVLPIWVTVQALGFENIIQRIQHTFQLTDYLLEKIEAFPEFSIIGTERIKSREGCSYNIKDIGKKSISTTVLFDILSSVVVFQYVPKRSSEGEQTSNIYRRNPPYFDNLNSWLVQLLARHIPTVKADILDLEDHGLCLRISFLESAHIMNTQKKDIDNFCSCLQHQLNILNATVNQRDLLYKNHSSNRKLKLVQITEWAGMGGARYIPEFWADRLNELTDTGKEDINNLNSELVAKLKTSDSAFSVGEADDGMLCVRFGMVDDELNMDELIHLVISAGQEIEDSSKFLETMSEMVKHGIEEANKELVQENQEKLMQEGVLRQVPVLGPLVSWWFPSQSEPGIKGRSFNLSSGTVESTENIYRYHMQIKEGSPQTPPPATKILISPSSCSSQPSQISPQQATVCEQNSATQH